MNYQTVVPFDANLRDAWFTDADTMPTALQGLVFQGIYIVTGTPTNTAGKYTKGAMIFNAIDGVWYQNKGTTASPNFSTHLN